MNQKLRRGPAWAGAVLLVLHLLLIFGGLVSLMIRVRGLYPLTENLRYYLFNLIFNTIWIVVLFRGKKDTLAGILSGVAAVMAIIDIWGSWDLVNILWVLFYAAICAGCFVSNKIDMRKLSWIFPVLGLIVMVLSVVSLVNMGFDVLSDLMRYNFTVILGWLISYAADACIGFAFLYAPEKAPAPAQETGYAANVAGGTAAPVYIPHVREYAHMNLGLHILLLLVTGGIWALIWVYRTTEYLNNTPGTTRQSAIGQLLLYMFVPFYAIYWFYAQGSRIDQMARSRRLPSNRATMCLLLGIFFPFLAMIIMQSAINEICDTAPVQQGA